MPDDLVARCPFEVTRRGEYDACDKPAVSVIRHEWEGDTYYDPACAYHAHMHGSSGVALTPTEVAVIAKRGRENRPGGEW